MSDKQQCFGVHAVEALLKRDASSVTELYIQEGRNDKRLQTILSLAQTANIRPRFVSINTLDELTNTQRHQGVVALCVSGKTYHENDLENLLANAKQPPLILILDTVQDPHNLGACLRSADAVGVDFVIAPKDKAVGLTPAARKVASGAAETVPFIQVTNLARTLEWLKEQGVWLYGAAGEATESVYTTDLTGAVALIMGGEENGLRRLTRDLCDFLIKIPMQGTVESLNVSVATGICLFEVLRQRGLTVQNQNRI
jgi:23S rRNA (guanosine2251-2'-O)-methyltransferase